MQKTKIEWADYTSNPIRFCDEQGNTVWGCVPVSEGCRNCYASAQNNRFNKNHFSAQNMRRLTSYLDEKELDALLKSRAIKDKRVFIGDMTDLFGEWVTDEFLDQLFAVLLYLPDTTFQLLTKRPERMKGYISSIASVAVDTERDQVIFDLWRSHYAESYGQQPWPSSHIWLGCSAENQKTYDDRWGHLARLRKMGWTTFLSLEPLLGPIDLRLSSRDLQPDWVIVGGESGPKARPMHPQWARELRDQCVAAKVPFFFKQWGVYLPTCQLQTEQQRIWMLSGNNAIPTRTPEDILDLESGQERMEHYRIGKKLAGRLLDGREWNEYPLPVHMANHGQVDEDNY